MAMEVEVVLLRVAWNCIAKGVLAWSRDLCTAMSSTDPELGAGVEIVGAGEGWGTVSFEGAGSVGIGSAPTQHSSSVGMEGGELDMVC